MAAGCKRGIFLTLDVVVAMMLIFTAILVAFAYFTAPQDQGFSGTLLRIYLQDAASVLARQGYLSAPLHSPGSSNTTGIRQVLLATPRTVCMQVLGYGTVVPEGIIGYWKFDEGAGFSSADWSGRGGGASLFGNAVFVESGRAGGAVSLDGQGSYASASDFSWAYNQSFTISGWARPSSLSSGNSLLVGKYDPSSPGSAEYALVSDAAGTLRFVYYNTAGGFAIDMSKSAAMLNGRWTHFAVAYDAFTHNATLYVNGAASANATSAGSHQNLAIPTRIGSGYFGGSQGYFNGAMDDVRIYDRPLQPAQISALYTNPSNLLYAANKPGCSYAGGEIASLTVPFAYNAGQEQDNYYYATLKAWLRGAR